jgi:DNA polymerase-3 subunit gamma/tau
MSYTALYRKWRPIVFEDVIGQKYISDILKNQILSGRISHAYLFCGTRGTGKTSTAKIFSRAVNCMVNKEGNPCNECVMCRGLIEGSIMDVIEIDAASNNGVDNIRDIRDEVIYSPAKGKYRVYIIDEVHMLSTGAFNALLKTLEEPPSHIIFILATTEPHKIPATVLSRCQRFDFKRISTGDILERLSLVAKQEGINIDDDGLRFISGVSDGSMRDALSILDRCTAFGGKNIKYKDIVKILGVVEKAFLYEFSLGIARYNPDKVMGLVEELIIEGRDITHFIDDLIVHFRNLLMCKVVKHPNDVLDTTNDDLADLKRVSDEFTQERLVYGIKELSETFLAAKWANSPRVILEIALMKLCRENIDTSNDALLARIAELEKIILRDGITIDNVSSQMMSNNNIKEKPILEDTKKVSSKAEEQYDAEPVTDLNKDFTKPKEEQNNNDETSKKDNIQDVIKLWPEIIKSIKDNQKKLYGFLTGERVDVKEQDGKLAIVFEFPIFQQQVQKEVQTIENIIKEITGQTVKVKCFMKDDLGEEEKSIKEDRLSQLADMQTKFGDIVEVYDE